MTNFLRANFLGERLRLIHDELTAVCTSVANRATTEACADCTLQDVMAIEDILELCSEIADFLEHLPCQPLVYTGDEPTDHMIALLDRLLAHYRLEQGTLTE